MPLSWNEIKNRALKFSSHWKVSGYEKGEAIPFWIDFFEIFGVTNKRVTTFEMAVKKNGGGQGFIDLFWTGQMLVEHKSRGKPLDAALGQALDYFPGIKERDLPHTLVVCDFGNFRVTNLESGQTTEFKLEDLHKNVKLFGFVAGYKVQQIKSQDPVNVKAALRMGKLHDALNDSGYQGHPLELLLVRVLFCLFADDTGIFQPAQSFRAFIEERTSEDGSDLGGRLGHFFQVLNTPEEKRSKALDEQLAAFPYVNGKLFEEALPMADFTADMRDALLDACALDWSAISPAIFGSLFQSIMDKEKRRNLGAHYTSEGNIMKVIKPLFLDELTAEFQKIKGVAAKQVEFHKKLRSLTFFDPACGCGNFLVISYRELRNLELELLRAAFKSDTQHLDVHSLIACDVDQFLGIEVEEFPSQIAQVALWLMDHQMNMKVSEEFGAYYARIPLKATPKVVFANALTTDWESVLPAAKCSYLFGNPPFSGKHYQSAQQKAEAVAVYDGMKAASDLDFVAAWFVKGAKYIQHSATRVAFVATNSLTQGEQVPLLWPLLLDKFDITIFFAHRTFQWSNDGAGVAAVHCVIVGFAKADIVPKRLYSYPTLKAAPSETTVRHISPYLTEAEDVVVRKHSKPIFPAPTMGCGSKPSDGGWLIFTEEEKDLFLVDEPGAAPYLRKFVGSQEFLNGDDRWCLWLVGADPAAMKNLPHIRKRVDAVRKFREASTAEPTRKAATTPTRFFHLAQPKQKYIAIPEVSSERRTYVPIGYLEPEVVASNKLYVIDEPSLFVLGVLQSSMHNAWTRTVGGRLKSDIQYSGTMVYNTFPWPSKEDVKRVKAVEDAAQSVLDARAAFPGSSLAQLYDPLFMPEALVKAHDQLNRAVERAYISQGGKTSYKDDNERTAFLFQLYEEASSILHLPKVLKTKAKVAAPP
jgi:hypothetical protein